MQHELADVGLVFFVAREQCDVIHQTLKAALQATPDSKTIDILVNGNAKLALEIAQSLGSASALDFGKGVRVWSIPVGDKANAWNQYIHHIWNGEPIAFFLDGYVKVNPDALALLGSAVLANERALGGSGVPMQGRSAATLSNIMMSQGGFHGNLCCIKGVVIQKMRDLGIRLPVGLYRTDSLMGAFLAFNLNPADNAWDKDRIYIHPHASWRVVPSNVSWWAKMRGQWNRLLRQKRGDLENAAYREHLAVRKLPPASLPDRAREMVLQWLTECPEDAAKLLKGGVLRRRAVDQIKGQQSLGSAKLLPELIWDNGVIRVEPDRRPDT